MTETPAYFDPFAEKWIGVRPDTRTGRLEDPVYRKYIVETASAAQILFTTSRLSTANLPVDEGWDE